MNNNAPIYSIIQFFSSPGVAMATVSGLSKIAILFAFTLYLVFGVVIIRQTHLMTRTVSTPLDPTIKLLAYAHMIASIFVWLMAFMLL
jgi:hypothetical protein